MSAQLKSLGVLGPYCLLIEMIVHETCALDVQSSVLGPLIWITETNTTAIVSTQSTAIQEMNAPVDTALLQTPTMSFGEVGITKEVEKEGYSNNAHSVGHMTVNKDLERMYLLATRNWTTTSTPPLYQQDVMQLLITQLYNDALLHYWALIRCGLEITIRLNTNNFYYGCLAATIYHTNNTGFHVDSRMVLNPTLISASMGESVLIKWKYAFPDAWMYTADLSDGAVYPVNLWLDILAPLTPSSAALPTSIEVQIWGRLTDVEIAWPTDNGGTVFREEKQLVRGSRKSDFDKHMENREKGKEKGDEVQSGVKVQMPKKKGTKHAASESVRDAMTTFDAISSFKIDDAKKAVEGIASEVISNWGAELIAGFLLDKPDVVEEQKRMIIEPNADLFSVDIPDTNVNFQMYKGRYADPGMSRMPSSSNFTVSDYARIPGLRQPALVYTGQGQSSLIDPIQLHNTGSNYKIPLDWAWLTSAQWRGSIKVLLKFYTSSFISARFTVEYINQLLGPDYCTHLGMGITKLINVRGDTDDCFTLPWLDTKWWSNTSAPQFKLTLESTIAATDTVTAPKIYCLVFIAGGDDIQFAYPLVPNPADWLPTTTGLSEDQVHSSPGEIFKQTFPPIGEGNFYDIDRGYCTTEMLGPITDIMKRYSPTLKPTTWLHPPTYGIQGTTLDYDPGDVHSDPHSTTYSNYFAFRNTYFGMWRNCFLSRSGGFRYRFYNQSVNDYNFTATIDSSATTASGTYYANFSDGVTRLTVPQSGLIPFMNLTTPSIYDTMGVASTTTIPIGNGIEYVAARDDIQVGYPILPTGLIVPDSALEKENNGKPSGPDNIIPSGGRMRKMVRSTSYRGQGSKDI